MSGIYSPSPRIIFMKVGVHAQESLEEIIARKQQEIQDAGHAFWGYGGNTCHPLNMVQPFARQSAERGNKIILCMQEMVSHHFAEPIRAEQYSVDGRAWHSVHNKINVLGSRYALVIRDLRRDVFDLPLSAARVAVGPSMGQTGVNYIRGRVDKACFEMVDQSSESSTATGETIKIDLVAELCEPYAVFLKN